MVFAIPLQALAIWLVQACTPYRIDLIELGTLMDGAKSDVANEVAFANLTRFLWPVIGYNLALWASASLLGNVLRRSVIQAEWDLEYPWLRFSSEWYYLLSGRQWGWRADEDFDLILVDVMTTIGITPLIYSGILNSIHFARDGSVESVTFTKGGKWDIPGVQAPTPIPGNVFVVKFDEILNLNFRLFKIDQEAPTPTAAAVPPAGGHLSDADASSAPAGELSAISCAIGAATASSSSSATSAS
jgi:hypothetical protein